MQHVCILLGSNLGNKRKYLDDAEKLITVKAGILITKSSVYKSEPWGFVHKEDFYNRAILINTNYSPLEILEKCLEIENMLGRERKADGYEARTIDIDILLYGKKIIKSKRLIVPHPQLHLRKFTLVPLCEIAPDLIHPELKLSMLHLLEKCPDRGRVEKLEAHF